MRGEARKEEKEEGWGREKQIMLRQRNEEEGISILIKIGKMDKWEREMEGGGEKQDKMVHVYVYYFYQLNGVGSTSILTFAFCTER